MPTTDFYAGARERLMPTTISYSGAFQTVDGTRHRLRRYEVNYRPVALDITSFDAPYSHYLPEWFVDGNLEFEYSDHIFFPGDLGVLLIAAENLGYTSMPIMLTEVSRNRSPDGRPSFSASFCGRGEMTYTETHPTEAIFREQNTEPMPVQSDTDITIRIPPELARDGQIDLQSFLRDEWSRNYERQLDAFFTVHDASNPPPYVVALPPEEGARYPNRRSSETTPPKPESASALTPCRRRLTIPISKD